MASPQNQQMIPAFSASCAEPHCEQMASIEAITPEKSIGRTSYTRTKKPIEHGNRRFRWSFTAIAVRSGGAVSPNGK
jgi:hypothetical protein